MSKEIYGGGFLPIIDCSEKIKLEDNSDLKKKSFDVSNIIDISKILSRPSKSHIDKLNYIKFNAIGNDDLNKIINYNKNSVNIDKINISNDNNIKRIKNITNKKTSNKKTSNKKTSNKKTSNKKTSNKKTSNKKTSNKKTSNKKTSNKKTSNKKTSNKKTSNKKTSNKINK